MLLEYTECKFCAVILCIYFAFHLDSWPRKPNKAILYYLNYKVKKGKFVPVF
jgi:hypothetical protein